MNKTLFMMLIASMALNAWLWKRYSDWQVESMALEARLAAKDELTRRLQEAESISKASTRAPGGSEDARELARLRNEIGQLREQLNSSRQPAPVAQATRENAILP